MGSYFRRLIMIVFQMSSQTQRQVDRTARLIAFTDSSFPPVFGFLAGREVKAAGAGNLGLRDRKPSLFFFRVALNL
jgi:hypothetical protein